MKPFDPEQSEDGDDSGEKPEGHQASSASPTRLRLGDAQDRIEEADGEMEDDSQELEVAQ